MWCWLWRFTGASSLTMSFDWYLVLERPYYITAHEIVVGLGLQKTHSFAVFNALDGCDAVSNFDGHERKTK